MSAPGNIRRSDLALPDSEAQRLLVHGYSGRLGTATLAGMPYVVPLLYVYHHAIVYLHTGNGDGHLVKNLAQNPQACFLVDEPGHVYGYGRFECDSALSYTSVMAFGVIAAVRDTPGKQEFCERLMAKYGSDIEPRPKGFFPRLEAINVYALTVNRLTGKAISLPAANARWPAKDRTLSPKATPPG